MSNYSAVVVKITKINPIPGKDRIVSVPIMGYNTIVDKSWSVGDLGVLFVAESQLSEEFCYENNLFRDATKNKDTTKTGYFEPNRRVRAIKFAGNRSDAFLMPFKAFGYTGVTSFKEGVEFSELNGHEICRKYVVRTKIAPQGYKSKSKVSRVAWFPEHFDTANWWRHPHWINPEELVTITQKLHGTSLRVGYTRVHRPWWPAWLGSSYKLVAGSRRVIKSVKNPKRNDNFYDCDIWTHAAQRFRGLVPKDHMIYAEIVGYTPEGSAIQGDYDYLYKKNEYEVFVYRITRLEAGEEVDLTWNEIYSFCTTRGLKMVPTLCIQSYKDFDPERWLDKRFIDEGYRQALPLNRGLVDEGICVRAESLPTPRVLKLKSPEFLRYETAELDAENEAVE